MNSTNKIRPLALAIIEHDNKILVYKANNKNTNKDFYRVLGGGIDFGETSEEALKREFKEETGSGLERIEFLKVFENIFVYNNLQMHELIFLYRAELKDKTKLGKNFDIMDRHHQRQAEWIDKEKLKKANFYPEGIEKFI
jgi:ADP-ribose pyrophosphatase YjhB (NUDIX family)